jgi:hypothetical protein
LSEQIIRIFFSVLAWTWKSNSTCLFCFSLQVITDIYPLSFVYLSLDLFNSFWSIQHSKHNQVDNILKYRIICLICLSYLLYNIVGILVTCAVLLLIIYNQSDLGFTESLVYNFRFCNLPGYWSQWEWGILWKWIQYQISQQRRREKSRLKNIFLSPWTKIYRPAKFFFFTLFVSHKAQKV